MAGFVLKIICSAGALFGAWMLLAVWVFYTEGFLSQLGVGTLVLKLGATTIRAACLFGCAWAAWSAPAWAAPLAWGACAAFVVGGAADHVYNYGLVEGFKDLMPTYYFAAAAHALFALLVSGLTSRAAVVGG